MNMEADDAAARKSSRKKRWLWGCGGGCLVVVLVFAGLCLWGVSFVKGKFNEMTAELEQMGFERRQTAQTVEVRESIEGKPLYVAQMVKILADAPGDVAIVAQMAEIHGKIDGTLYFRGQMLTIMANAEITGDVNVKAQAVRNLGKVGGNVTGAYQTLQNE